eukprot:TRINITY_DN872_c0_g1_i4.p1 TRINITY_DN872_c0_g1~~TRINITY_DN872_c0_g1_i4.p1  ORF type:complete len:645 (+),score=171.79 TRINITY_DN872_c0_g1_i4:291-2225(+)
MLEMQFPVGESVKLMEQKNPKSACIIAAGRRDTTNGLKSVQEDLHRKLIFQGTHNLDQCLWLKFISICFVFLSFRTHTIGHTGPKQKGVSKFILEKPEELKTFDVLEAKMKSLVKTDGPPFSPASDVIEVSQYVNNVVIDAVFESKSLLSRLDQFLQGIVILSLKYLKKNHDMPDALAQALWRTFDGDLKDRRFFVTYGVFFDEPITEGRFARRNVHPVQEAVQYDDSAYLIAYVNMFGEEGGFDAIAATIEDKKTALNRLPKYMKILKAASRVFPPEFEKSYLTSVSDLVIKRLHTAMGDVEDMKSIEDKSVAELKTDLLDLLKYVASPEDLAGITRRLAEVVPPQDQLELHFLVDEKYAHDHDLVCVVCQNILQDPVMITSCQHSHCKECLDEWTKKQSQCPVCRSEIKETLPDRRAKRQISLLKVRCKNNEYGCDSTGELGSAPLTFWVKHQPECPVKTCEFCSLKTKTLDSHLQECEFAVVDCPFKKLGCNAKLKKKDGEKGLRKHVDSSMEWHYFLMVKVFSEQDQELSGLPKVIGALQNWGDMQGCSVCGKKPIPGFAFKCTTCPNGAKHGEPFTMCLECKSLSGHDESHNIVRLAGGEEDFKVDGVDEARKFAIDRHHCVSTLLSSRKSSSSSSVIE